MFYVPGVRCTVTFILTDPPLEFFDIHCIIKFYVSSVFRLSKDFFTVKKDGSVERNERTLLRLSGTTKDLWTGHCVNS